MLQKVERKRAKLDTFLVEINLFVRVLAFVDEVVDIRGRTLVLLA